MIQAFEDDFGRAPRPGEIAAVVEQMFIEGRLSNRLLVEHMASLYNKAFHQFGPLALEVGRVVPGRHELLTGDSPVVLADGIRVGTANGVALTEADLIYFPLGPKTAVSLKTSTETELWIPPVGVQELNHLLWRNCRLQLAARPGSDWQRSLARGSRP